MPSISTAVSRRGLRAAGLFVSGTVALLLAARPWGTDPAEPVSATTLVLPTRPAALRLAAPTGLPAVGKAAPVAADTSAQGMAGIWADLERRSYFLDPDAAVPATRHATNAAQRLTARLTPATYTLAAAVPASSSPASSSLARGLAPPSKPAWQVRLTLRGIGRAGRLAFRPASAPALAATTDTSVRYQHGAAFTTEYTNTPAGLRQNYYLARRPAGTTGPVQVQLALATTLRASATTDGQAVDFAPAGSSGSVLRYGSLKAWDATRRVLPSRLRLNSAAALALEVDDAGATYPLTIDPLASTAPDIREGEAAGDLSGRGVAGAGDVNGDGYADVIIGALGNNSQTGKIYVYYGSAAGLSAAAPDTRVGEAGNNQFGIYVAGAGDVNGDGYADVAVAAPNANSVTGTVYLYYGSASGLKTTAPSIRYGEAGNNRFGTGLAGAGDVNGDGYADLLVGAPGNDFFKGKVYLYYGAATGLSATDPSTLTGGVSNESFGGRVAGAGDVNGDGYADVVIAADGYNSNTGRASVFYGSASGLRATTPSIRYGEASNDYFGQSVAGAGDVNGDGYADVLIGAPRVNSQTGKAYVFYGSAAGLSAAAPDTRTGETTSNSFGYSVAGAGDVNGDGYADVLVGASSFNSVTGKVYVYYGSATGLSTVAPDTRTGETTGTQFGISVAGAGDVNGDGYADLLIGAPSINDGKGKAYVYYGTTAGLSTTASLSRAGEAAYYFFGYTVAGAGDVDGDGYADVVVGAFGTSPGGRANAGSAFLYRGSAAGLSATAATRLDGAAANDEFGVSVAGAGDVDGDGYADVIIGAHLADPGGRPNAGSAYLYRGSAAGLSATAATRLDGAAASDFFGSSLAGAGDVDGDGYADVVVGADGADPNGLNTAGSAYLYRGSAAGLSTTAATQLDGAAALDFFGQSLAGAGDVDGDGYADVLVGADGADPDRRDAAGSVYLYRGSAAGLSTTAAVRLDGALARDFFGRSVAGAGDVNGDGYADVLVGAHRADPDGRTDAGSVYLYQGSATGLSTTAAVRLDGAAATDEFGFRVAGAGDVDGDGYADVVVGAYQADPGGRTDAGSVYLYRGSATGLSSAAATRLDGVAASDEFGIGLAGAGDVDGDGYGDVIVGADRNDAGGRIDAGSVYLYRGNAGTARRGALRLYNTDLITSISAANKPLGQFGLGLVARSPYGRGRVRLVWEARANGQPFSSSSPITNSTQYSGRGPWTDVPAGTVAELKSLVNKVGLATKVRARLEYATSSPLAPGSPTAGTGGVGGQARYGPWTYVSAQQLGQSSSAATPLPVELTAFTAAPEGEAAVRLIWATASENNSADFEVQRSTNGKLFVAVGTLAAAGHSTARRSYTLLDQQLPAGATTLYYRLRQVDTDGSFSYSPVRVVARAALLSAYPNPTTGVATLTGALPGAALQVFTPLGRLVLSTRADATGAVRLQLPASLPAGVYLLKSGSQIVRLVRE